MDNVARFSNPLLSFLTLIVLAASLFGILSAEPAPLEQQPNPDSREYADAALQLALGNGYVTVVHDNIPQPPRYPPGFSIILAPFAAIGTFPDNVFVGVKVVAMLYVTITVMAAWTLGGPLAGLVAALLIYVSPFAFRSGVYVMSDAFYATLVVAAFVSLNQVTSRRVIAASVLLGFSILVRLSGVVGILALILALKKPHRLTAIAAAAPFLVAIALFNWNTFGSPIRTGYDYWLPKIVEFDLSYASAIAGNGFTDGAEHIGEDKLDGAIMRRVCNCPRGTSPQRALPSPVVYPAVLLGLYWIFVPPLTTVLGGVYLWSERRRTHARFTLYFGAMTLVMFTFYFFQAVRFMAAPATLLLVCSAVFTARLVCKLAERLAARRAQTAVQVA